MEQSFLTLTVLFGLKITSTTSRVAQNNSCKTHNLVVNGTFCDEVRSMLSDVKSIRDGQNSSDSILGSIQTDNKSLWRDVDMLRSQHHKQRRVIEKLIQFLLSLIQQNRNNIVKKRKVRLMINNQNSSGSFNDDANNNNNTDGDNSDGMSPGSSVGVCSSNVPAGVELISSAMMMAAAHENHSQICQMAVDSSGLSSSAGSTDNRSGSSDDCSGPQGGLHLVRNSSPRSFMTLCQSSAPSSEPTCGDEQPQVGEERGPPVASPASHLQRRSSSHQQNAQHLQPHQKHQQQLNSLQPINQHHRHSHHQQPHNNNNLNNHQQQQHHQNHHLNQQQYLASAASSRENSAEFPDQIDTRSSSTSSSARLPMSSGTSGPHGANQTTPTSGNLSGQILRASSRASQDNINLNSSSSPGASINLSSGPSALSGYSQQMLTLSSFSNGQCNAQHQLQLQQQQQEQQQQQQQMIMMSPANNMHGRQQQHQHLGANCQHLATQWTANGVYHTMGGQLDMDEAGLQHQQQQQLAGMDGMNPFGDLRIAQQSAFLSGSASSPLDNSGLASSATGLMGPLLGSINGLNGSGGSGNTGSTNNNTNTSNFQLI